ncbi:hypothetical protein [Companilactobacillus nuruki]|uniref:Uncharacterized protein n=1 Tax=Companilactobacillus nuruki TaxID=1993540 RepID=A0A2N7ASJ8_9LACO|nr:hypothetical protein [Companilactobacillus nuruki]PMD68334.1 hypothetical protein CBP76_09765 [Companilactobacillus nuruki]
MKTKIKISYVILKYDDQTDNIFTKVTNNENHLYELPTFDYVQKQDGNLNDVKRYILEKMIDFDVYLNERDIFIPFVNISFENQIIIYDYVAIVFESNKTALSAMSYESWYRINFNHKRQVWNLEWGSGVTDPIDMKLNNSAFTNFRVNSGDNDGINFDNVMYFITEQTRDFPILGLLSGDFFTMKQVQHYQDLLGIDALKAGSNETFERQYADSIQVIKDDHLTTAYKFKKEYLKK